jgi:hypothetical protein
LRIRLALSAVVPTEEIGSRGGQFGNLFKVDFTVFTPCRDILLG